MKTHPVPLRRHFLSAALLGLLLSVHAPAADQTATWNGTTGNWSDFTKWNTNPLFPNNGNGGFTFDAVQTTGTVTVDQAITIQKLTLSGIGSTNTGAGFTLTTNELFTFQGGATLNGTGTVQADGGVAFGTGNTTLSGGRTLNLGGNSTWSAGAIQFFDNSVLTNQAGVTFTTSQDSGMSGGSGGALSTTRAPSPKAPAPSPPSLSPPTTPARSAWKAARSLSTPAAHTAESSLPTREPRCASAAARILWRRAPPSPEPARSSSAPAR